ncbi:MAG: FUSC family protein [Sarcina sp.]
MQNLKLPKIGARNLKTALAVVLCVLLFKVSYRPYPFYACIAAVICMKDNVKSSVKIGKNRMVGTLIGGLVGLIITILAKYLYLQNFSALLTGLGIIITIYSCNLCNKKESVTIACIVLIAIMVNLKGTAPFAYALNRILDTFVGIIIALLINKFICNNEKLKLEKKIKTDIKKFENFEKHIIK